MNSKRTALMFKAFCDENRLQILDLLRDGEKCACKLLEEIRKCVDYFSKDTEVANTKSCCNK